MSSDEEEKQMLADVGGSINNYKGLLSRLLGDVSEGISSLEQTEEDNTWIKNTLKFKHKTLSKATYS